MNLYCHLQLSHLDTVVVPDTLLRDCSPVRDHLLPFETHHISEGDSDSISSQKQTMPVLQKGNHNPYQYISKDLLDCKTLKFAKSDQVHESLHPLLDTLSKQQSEIAELENMLDNFDEFWMSGWKSSQEPGSFVLEEMQASEGGMMLDHDEEELFFQ